MGSNVITINPYSLLDIIAIAFAVPLAVAFYALHGKVTHRRVDLAFAHLLACTAMFAFADLMLLNATTPFPALVWLRGVYVVGAISLPLVIHFVYAFVDHDPPGAGRVLAAFWILAGVLIVLTTSPLFLLPATRNRGAVSWRNVAPHMPDLGPLAAVFLLSWLFVMTYALVALWRHQRTLPPTARPQRRHTRLLIFGFFTMMVSPFLDVALTYGMDLMVPSTTLAGIMAMCAPAAVSLGEQIVQRERLKNALASYVAPHVSAAILEEGLHLGGETRDVSVMFADIRGFTEMSNRMAPEELVDLLNRYFAAMAAAIFRHGGMLNKTIGDGLLAVFGAPQALENHALAALRAACDMRLALDDANTEWAAHGLGPVRIGIGIHTGDVVIGNMGNQEHVDYTVIGDVVNVASHVEQHTKKVRRAILLTHATYDRVGGMALVEEVEAVRMATGDRSIGVVALNGLSGGTGVPSPR
jgi:class 3 adenylate cyclase